MARLKSRAPWLLLLSFVLLAVSVRSDLALREQARRQADQLAQQLAVSSGEVGNLDLSWLALYPEVRTARIDTASGQTLGTYQAADALTDNDRHTYSATSGRDAVEVQLARELPAWPALRTELPLMLLVTVLLALAVPSRPSALPQTNGPKAGGEPLSLLSPVPTVPANLVLELDPDLRIQRVSRGVERYGYTARQLLGLPVADLIARFHPGHPDALVAVAQAAGGQLDSVVSSSTILSDRGALEKVVVTLAPPGQAGLTARYAGLQQLCQAICDHARDAVLVLDRSATVVYANIAFRTLCPGGATGQAILAAINPEHRLCFTNSIQAALEGHSDEILEFSLTGSAALLEGAFHALSPAEPGGDSLAVGIFRDVAPARRLAEELESARQRAGHSQKIEALGRMAGGVAHDFNNLLATIVFNLEAARAALEAQDPAQSYLGEMQLATDRACAVTRQLLLYSRKKPSQLCRVPCHEAIKNAVRLTQGSRASGALHLHLGASSDEVLLEDGQIEQILVNLLVNARDAMGPQGGIEVSTEGLDFPQPGAPGILLRVKDAGPGIPAEIRGKIFEPYFTTKEVGKGTGLGLSTALAIVEKAGGQMTLADTPVGACFEIRLPLAPEPQAEKTGAEALPPPVRADAAVLLVEDEASIRHLLHRLLEQYGYQVTSAATGADAAEILGNQSGFDVLVTDLVLPGLSGPELARLFQRSRPGSPVLFMSGFPGDTLDETELSANSQFLAKPFSHEQLLGSLRRLLGQPA